MAKQRMNRRELMRASAILAASVAGWEAGAAGATGAKAAAAPSRTPNKTEPIVRISMGVYPPDKEREVVEGLSFSGKAIESAITKLPGLISYYSGVDRNTKVMMNVSLWKDVPSANQMSTLQAMLDLGGVFTNLGVKFTRPIPNCETLWSWTGSKASG
jgi:hypothetical protein